VAAATLALLLAAAPEASLRDGARARELAGATYAARPGPLTGQVLAMALAEAGRFEEAARAQGRLLAGLERAATPAALAAARARLALYEQGRAVREPWREEPALLPPPWLPLPPAGAREPE
jgi:hypothetical protein